MDMVKFDNIVYLNLYWIIIPLIIFYIFVQTKYWKKKKRFISNEMQSLLLSSYSKKRKGIKNIILFISVIFVIFALTGPKIGTKAIKAKREGIDITVALDLSQSMLAQDITPNRIEKSKYEVRKFINGLKGDRIALVGFTSQGFIQCPLTSDYDAALLFLDLMAPDLLPQDGTSLSEAINTSVSCFNKKDKKHKLLIIVSDGEDHEAHISDAIKKAVETGVTIYTIGIGTANGVPIPSKDGFLKDNANNTVITKLNEFELKKIAVEGNGNYYRAATSQDLSVIFKDISKIDKKKYETKIYKDFEEQFQVFLLISIVLLIAMSFISDGKKESLNF